MKRWTARRLFCDVSDFPQSSVIGVSRGTKLVGGFIYHRWNGHDCEVSCVVEDPKLWANRGVIRALFSYPFLQLGCSRLSCTTSIDGYKATKLAMKIGFRAEGMKRRGYDGVTDAYIFGMLREECRWLRF